jgi:hypothetical protein
MLRGFPTLTLKLFNERRTVNPLNIADGHFLAAIHRLAILYPGDQIMGSSSPIKRFPRLATAANAAAYAQLLWTDPDLTISFRKESFATEFIFTVKIAPQFRESYALAYRMIFEHFDWETAVREAYDKGKYGGKQIPAYISLGLHQVFMDALKKWRRYVRGLAHENELVSGTQLDDLLLGDLSKSFKRKTGPQPNPHVALWAAERFESLRPRISKLRSTFRNLPDLAKDRNLREAVEALAPWDVVRRALTMIFAEQDRITPRHLLTPTPSNHKLTSAIVQVELEDKGCDFHNITLRTYLRLGRKLLDFLGSDRNASRKTDPRG